MSQPAPSMYRHTDLGISRSTLRELSVAAQADPRSVVRELRHLKGELDRGVRGMSGERIRRALAERGLLPSAGA